MSIAEIKNMTTAERLEAMELLWDALCHEDIEIGSPDWHEPILDKRRQRINSGKAKFYTLEEVKKRFCG